ncbi:sugar transferase [Sphingomonas sp. CFBP 8760]|uniref:sugar transferase n=1 Tax=Sphingomonas sp. CFBP 8760 TaxID=2775282 RepID=UPI00177BD13C|nr:sugar transferase [Sphingomonas sp. CFBP 8760]MBD8548178.1 sugar transferase [Sphingomonas sp. CFBP 8760]
MFIGRKTSGRQSRGAFLASFWTQLSLTIVLAVVAPAIALYPDMALASAGFDPVRNSMAGAILATVIGITFIGRVTAYPGAKAFGFILPSFAATYATVFTFFFAFRIDYGRLYFASSFLIALIVAYGLNFLIERYVIPRFFVVPFGDAKELMLIDYVNWVVLTEPTVPMPRGTPIVADLRYDFDDNWERMLAEAAVDGHPVYHFKQLGESLTGRVSISHMSENSFGSLLPNLGYRNVKRIIDIVASFILLPLLIVPFAMIAALIAMDSPGNPFFLQKRMGFRGREFRMIKFRTMKVRLAVADTEAARHDAMTQSDDARITRVGRFLRRTRLDETPQIFNVIKGEMSFIGPRPEAIALSKWYEKELAFYLYRHIVRPGITGWAQVNQGHVADLESVGQKLNYDFFYIKNFSSWLDILIVFKTVRTIMTGFGSK